MFIIIVKSPNVKSIIGKEISLSTGFIKKFIKPKINPAVSNGIRLSGFEKVNPVTNLAAI